jgi:flavorubredoxin
LTFAFSSAIGFFNGPVRLSQEKSLNSRFARVFGSYGWSGGKVNGFKGFVERNKLMPVEAVVGARFSAEDDEFEQFRQPGRNVASGIEGK